MILTMTINFDANDQGLQDRNYEFIDYTTKQVVATAHNHLHDHTNVIVDKKLIFQSLKKMERKFFDTPYTFDMPGLKKAIGFRLVDEDNNIVMQGHRDCLTVAKKGIFKRNMEAFYYNYEDKDYVLYHVGFKKSLSHFYFIYEDNKKVVGALERTNYGDNNRIAVVYIKDERYMKLMCLIAANCFVNVGREDDYSAGPYISRYEEETALFDQGFLDEVKNDVNYIDEYYLEYLNDIKS